jgi:hypothetical protein
VQTAVALTNTVRSMTVPERADIGRLAGRVEQAVHDATADQSSVVDTTTLLQLTAMTVDAGTPFAPAIPPAPAAIEAPPTTHRELDSQIRELDVQQTEATRAEAVKAEVVSLALTMISQAISLATPISAESVKMVFEDWLDNVAEELKPKLEGGASPEAASQASRDLSTTEGKLLLASADIASLTDLRSFAETVVADDAAVVAQEQEQERRTEEEDKDVEAGE